MALPQEKSTYNRSRNWTTQLSPFDIVYGNDLSGILELLLILYVGHLSVQTKDMEVYFHIVACSGQEKKLL